MILFGVCPGFQVTLRDLPKICYYVFQWNKSELRSQPRFVKRLQSDIFFSDGLDVETRLKFDYPANGNSLCFQYTNVAHIYQTFHSVKIMELCFVRNSVRDLKLLVPFLVQTRNRSNLQLV